MSVYSQTRRTFANQKQDRSPGEIPDKRDRISFRNPASATTNNSGAFWSRLTTTNGRGSLGGHRRTHTLGKRRQQLSRSSLAVPSSDGNSSLFLQDHSWKEGASTSKPDSGRESSSEEEEEEEEKDLSSSPSSVPPDYTTHTHNTQKKKFCCICFFFLPPFHNPPSLFFPRSTQHPIALSLLPPPLLLDHRSHHHRHLPSNSALFPTANRRRRPSLTISKRGEEKKSGREKREGKRRRGLMYFSSILQ